MQPTEHSPPAEQCVRLEHAICGHHVNHSWADIAADAVSIMKPPLLYVGRC